MTRILLLTCSLSLLTATVFGQTAPRYKPGGAKVPNPPPITPAVTPGGGYIGGGYGYGGYGHASTAEEGAALGYAAVIQSAGQANLLNAQAATQGEIARSAYLQNRLLATQTYFQMREANKAYRDATADKPLSMEQYVKLAKQNAPDRLSASELDSFNGKIYWPPQLMGAEYAEYRANLSALFNRRALGDTRTYKEVETETNALLALLESNIDQFKPQDYIKAKNFVQSLAYETTFALR